MTCPFVDFNWSKRLLGIRSAMLTQALIFLIRIGGSSKVKTCLEARYIGLTVDFCRRHRRLWISLSNKSVNLRRKSILRDHVDRFKEYLYINEFSHALNPSKKNNYLSTTTNVNTCEKSEKSQSNDFKKAPNTKAKLALNAHL